MFVSFLLLFCFICQRLPPSGGSYPYGIPTVSCSALRYFDWNFIRKRIIFEKIVKMKTIQLHIPDTVDLNDREAKMLLASRLYEKGKLSLGQAAELAGLSKRAFMEILGDYDVSIFNYPLSELDNDIKNAQDYCF